MRFMRRAAVVAAATVSGIALAAGPASAHYCYFHHFTEQAAEGRAGSNGFMTLGDMVYYGAQAEFGVTLCDAGVEAFATTVGGTTDTLINAHGGMAAGRPGGNKAIGHLHFENFEAAVVAAFTACGLELPEMPPA